MSAAPDVPASLLVPPTRRGARARRTRGHSRGRRWLLHALALLFLVPAGRSGAEQVGASGLVPDFAVKPLGPGVACYRDGTLPPAWADIDGDGWLDLPLYRNNRDGTFSEIPGFRALLAGGNYHGAAFGDYDNDGRPDLALLAYGEGRSLLLHNLGGGAFTDVAPALGLDVAGHGETATWGDYDGDGFLDLFTPYYAFVPPFRSFLYRNRGDGTFTDVAAAAGVALADVPADLNAEGAQWVDWNGDGRLDLYVASHLFQNDGRGGFTDVREQVGLPVVFDEGAMFVDYDDDGDLDLYLRAATGGRLFRNEGASFTEVTARSGIPPSALKWGDNWADVDHDGWPDLLYVRPDAPALLLRNQGDGTFVEWAPFTALDVRTGSSAFGDYDNDGDLDAAVGNRCRSLLDSRLDAQPGFAGSSLRVRVVDAAGRENQHGATVHLRRVGSPGAAIQTRAVDGGSGYLTQNEYAVHFGVDPAATYALDVTFPSAGPAPVALNPATTPILGAIVPRNIPNGRIEIYRDGWVVIDHRGQESNAPPPNLLADGGMEQDDDGDRVPDGWRGAPREAAARRVSGASAPAFAGTAAFRFVGKAGAPMRTLAQSVVGLSGAPGDRVDLSLWARGEIPAGGLARAQLRLKSGGALTERFDLRLPVGGGPYGRFVESIVATHAYDEVEVRLQHRASSGRLLIDEVALLRR